MSRGIQDSLTLTLLDQLELPFDDASKRKKRGGSIHGASIHNPATYEALKSKGMSKESAAAISNAALNKGYAKGKHGRSKKRK
jgi:hypothetical protein